MAFNLEGRIRIKDDGASKALDNVKKSMEKAHKAAESYRDANGRLRDAQGKFVAGAGKAQSSLSLIEKATKKAEKAMKNLNTKTKDLFRSLGSGAIKGAGITGIAALGTAAYAGYKSLNKAMDFEAQMSSIAALTGASQTEMAQMQSLALKMGAATKYNALEAGQAIEELLKAGLTPATVQTGALEAALNLATAGELDLASAAEIMSTALNAFQEDGMSAAQAANILAGTANASATGVEDLRYSLSMASAVASGLGMTFEDTNVALGVFANRGLKGSDAGTSLKTMLQTLQPVTDEQIGLFRELGLMTEDGSNKFFDAAGNIKSLNDIAGTLRTSLGKLTNQERQHALKLMFGTDAVRAATILYKEGAEGVDKFRKEMSNVTALDVARKKMDNASGAVEQFSGAIETLQIAGMMPVLPIVKDLANAAADFVERYTPKIVAGVQSMVDNAKSYVKTHFIDNPEFAQLPDIPSKIVFIFEDVMQSFRKWWGQAGAGHFKKMVEEITKFIVGGLQAAVPQMAAVGLSMGKELVSGILSAIKGDPIANAVLLGGAGGAVAGLPGLAVGAAAGAVTGGIQGGQKRDDLVEKYRSGKMSPDEKAAFEQMGVAMIKKKAFGFSGGINNVPYNGMIARLHKGEEVLTREESKRYRGENGANGTGGSRPVVISGNNFYVREEADIEKIAKRLAYEMAQ
ncbi:phage tail tape measure protein [Paenibacillus dakarensis]|uniref:phage tail tape measure protein n=1 Tax=Paenibacillus dakarensis TaxID=1527293 RepID=UPI0006D57E83|nr:phage tail tape measure protein [Paenibacillus dakarensis]